VTKSKSLTKCKKTHAGVRLYVFNQKLGGRAHALDQKKAVAGPNGKGTIQGEREMQH